MKTSNIKYDNIDDLELFILKNNYKNSSSILIQIFSGSLEKKVLENITKTISKNIPHSIIIGSTTDGEILQSEVYTHSIIISFSTFEHTDINISHINDINYDNSYDSGKNLAQNLIHKDSKVFIIFADALHTNGEEFLNGVKSISNDITISGGLSGDNAKFNFTYLICNEKVFSQGAVGISLNSTVLNIYTDYSFSWRSIGKKFLVNKSDKCIVYEIDGMTPYALYKKYLGKDIANLLPDVGIEFPLIIENENVGIARAPLKLNTDGSLVFAGNIKEGAKVRFALGDSDTMLNDATKLAIKVSKLNTQSIFVYSCMARRRFLDKLIHSDVNSLSKLTNLSGFFTYGEFYTSKDNNLNLLNESMTILSLSESSETSNQIELVQNDLKSTKANNLYALLNLVKVTNDELTTLNQSLEIKIEEEILKNKNAQKELYSSIKMASLGDMISNIAHQWRQPLSIITTCASGMQLHKDLNVLSDDMFLNYTETIVSQGKHLSDTINIFREYIQDEHTLSDVIIQTEIKSTLQLLNSVIKDNNIKLIQNINYNKTIMLKLISGELSQVMINIINNSKDAFIEKKIVDKEISISLEVEKHRCVVSIEDNAGGIPDHIIGKIFEPYYTTKAKDIGTGIGLYMSYEIITSHLNGNLSVENTKKGAKFSIVLPRNLG